MPEDINETKKLRSFLNPSIKGPNVDKILAALGAGTQYITSNVEKVHDQIFITSASGRYLDQRLADFNVTRPENVGLDDSVFREIGIAVINRKQVRDLLNQILLSVFGDESTNATSGSATYEPFNLQDGDTLSLKFDGASPVSVVFSASQFTSINAAKAQEVADAITIGLRKQGHGGRAFTKDDGLGPYVVLISDTVGPSSSVTVTGGRAQNVLRFPQIRPTTADFTTQWTITKVSGGGSLRFTWTGGASPNIGKVRPTDYVNIFGTSFNLANRGTYTVITVKGGIAGTAYFEISNPNGVAEVVTQGTSDAALFFQPFRSLINSKVRYAAIYQTETSLLEVFIPATTKVVRRDRIGSAHLHEPVFVTETFTPGANEIFDITTPAPGSISDGQYIIFNSPTTAFYLYFDTTGANATNPAPVGRTAIRVITFGLTTATQVAQAVAVQIQSTGQFGSVVPSAPTVRVNALSVGAVPAPANVNVPGLTISAYQVGSNLSDVTTSTPNPDESLPDQQGPYVFDPTQPFVISSVETLASQTLNPDTGRVVPVVNSSQFPDSQGFLIFGYGTSHQEGPIPYIARPSNGTLLLNPSYRIKNIHPSGTDIALVAYKGPVQIAQDGSDFAFYCTGVVEGRIYAEDLINSVSATGITILINIIYPGDTGLGKYGTLFSEKTIVWGP